MVVPEVGHQVPAAPEEYDTMEQDGIRVYASHKIRLNGPVLVICLERGWFSRRIGVLGIRLTP